MYIGNDLQIANPSYKVIDDISSSFNGSATSFALNVKGATPVPFPINEQQVMISVNGVIQEPDATGSAGFKLLGSNIVFSSAPANGNAFFGVILAGADYVTAGSEFPDGTVTAPSFTFESDLDSGFFRSGSGAVGYSANGVQKALFDGNGLTVTGTCTATSFSGNGANLTNISASSVGTLASLTVTGDVTVDTNTLHVDATNNRVGIGTTSPDRKLHVASSFIRVDDGYGLDTSGGTEKIVMDAGHIAFNVSSAERMRINSSGNVGIGTTNPQFKVDVNGELASKNASKEFIALHLTNNEARIRSSFYSGASGAYRPITFFTSDNERMRIDSSGRLLLGTTADLSNNDTNALLQVFTPTSAKILLGRVDSSISSGNFLGMVDFHGTDGTSSQRCARVGAVASGDHSTDDKPTDLVFQTCADGAGTSTERMRIDNSGRVIVGGSSFDSNNYFGNGIHLKHASNTGIKFQRTASGSAATWDIGINTTGVLDFAYVGDSGGSSTRMIRVDESGNLDVENGSIQDSKGNVRKIIQNTQGSAYTLVAADSGKHILASGNVTVSNNVFSAGDAVTIVNNTSGDITIVKAMNDFYFTNDGTVGDRTLATRGMATILFTSATAAYISGAGLS